MPTPITKGELKHPGHAFIHRPKCVFAVAVVLLLALGHSLGAQDAPPEGHKLALLIGIDDYRYGGIPDLQGSVNDVRLMKQLLVERFGFPDDPSHIRVLLNEQATRRNILNGIEQHLIAQARKDSLVVLHFSGHGSQRVDGVGSDEADGLDETLLPVDSGRAPHPNRDISDDELHALLKRLAVKAAHATFVFDSCHAGSLMRSGGRARSVAADLRTVEGEDHRKVTHPPVTQRSSASGWPADGAYTLIAGAAATENAYEIDLGGHSYGALTWHLVQAIRGSEDGATYRDIMGTVTSQVTARFARQHPQLEGGGAETMVFGVSSSGQGRPIPVRRLDGLWHLLAGRTGGVTPGSIFQLHRPGVMGRGLSESSAAVAEVMEAGSTTAALRLLDGSLTGSNAEAVEVMRRPSPWRPRILLESVSGSPILKRLAKSLDPLVHLEVVDRGDDYTLRIHDDGRHLQWEGSGEPLRKAVDAVDVRAVETLRRQLLERIRWMQLLALESRHRDLSMDFDVQLVRTRGQGEAGRRPADLRVAPGDHFEVRIQNRSDFPVYFTLVDLIGSGGLQMMFPPATARSTGARIEPGGAWSERLRADLPDGIPAERHVLKLLVASHPNNLTFLMGAPPSQEALDAALGTTVDDIEWTLSRAAWGLSPSQAPPGGLPAPWATYERVVEIRRPGI